MTTSSQRGQQSPWSLGGVIPPRFQARGPARQPLQPFNPETHPTPTSIPILPPYYRLFQHYIRSLAIKQTSLFSLHIH